MLTLNGFVDVSELLRPGVYALVRDGAVVYVGQSKKLLARVSAHRSNWGRKATPAWMPASIRGVLFDQVYIRPCRVEDLNAIEAEMINLYKPKLNIQLKQPSAPITGPFTLKVGNHPLTFNAPPPPRVAPQRFERRI